MFSKKQHVSPGYPSFVWLSQRLVQLVQVTESAPIKAGIGSILSPARMRKIGLLISGHQNPQNLFFPHWMTSIATDDSSKFFHEISGILVLISKTPAGKQTWQQEYLVVCTSRSLVNHFTTTSLWILRKGTSYTKWIKCCLQICDKFAEMLREFPLPCWLPLGFTRWKRTRGHKYK